MIYQGIDVAILHMSGKTQSFKSGVVVVAMFGWNFVN